MQGLYLLGSRPVYLSGDESDVFNSYSSDGFSEVLDTFVASDVILYNSDLSQSKQIRAIIQKKISDSPSSSMEKTIISETGELSGYAYVYFENNYYILDGLHGDIGFYQKGDISLCNWILKWQNLSGDIISRYANIKSTSLTSDGIDSNTKTDIGKSGFFIKIPIDNESLSVKRNHKFVIDRSTYDKKVYELSNPNNITSYYGNYGVTSWVANEIQYTLSENDLLYGVVGYFEIDDSPAYTGKYSIISGSNLLTIGNSSSFSVIFYEDGDVVSITPTWNISGDYEDYISYTTNGNTISIFTNHEEAIGSQIALQITNSSYESHVDIQIQSL